MNAPTTRGFTLLELLLAVALSAVVAAAAGVASGMFAELDMRTVQGTELRVDVQRAMELVRRDVASANTIDLRGNQIELGYDDGSVVVYAVPAGASELHRFRGAGLATLLLPLQALLTAAAPVLQYDARGHLRDACYSATAVLQGVTAIANTPITSALDGATIGIVLRIAHPDGESGVARRRVAPALREAHTTLTSRPAHGCAAAAHWRSASPSRRQTRQSCSTRAPCFS
jgi:prepilin-type N-terminal cleavage/methylation domain-containing protein